MSWPYDIKPNETRMGPAGTVRATENGIIAVHMTPGLDFNLETGKAMAAFMRKATNGQRFPVMLVPGDGLQIRKETREFMRSPETTKFRTATAIVTTNLALKLIGNFFVKLNSKNHPSKVFKTEGEALKWLAQFVETRVKNKTKEGCYAN